MDRTRDGRMRPTVCLVAVAAMLVGSIALIRLAHATDIQDSTCGLADSTCTNGGTPAPYAGCGGYDPDEHCEQRDCTYCKMDNPPQTAYCIFYNGSSCKPTDAAKSKCGKQWKRKCKKDTTIDPICMCPGMGGTEHADDCEYSKCTP